MYSLGQYRSREVSSYSLLLALAQYTGLELNTGCATRRGATKNIELFIFAHMYMLLERAWRLVGGGNQEGSDERRRAVVQNGLPAI